LVWQEFPKSIRLLLDNEYVYADFWKSQNGTLPKEAWKGSFEAANRAAKFALGRQDTVTVLSIVLSRIYTLRNQLIHGGATWGCPPQILDLRRTDPVAGPSPGCGMIVA
jgi:hypothetical protein